MRNRPRGFRFPTIGIVVFFIGLLFTAPFFHNGCDGFPSRIENFSGLHYAFPRKHDGHFPSPPSICPLSPQCLSQAMSAACNRKQVDPLSLSRKEWIKIKPSPPEKGFQHPLCTSNRFPPFASCIFPSKPSLKPLHTLTDRIQLRLSWRYTQNYFCDLRYFLKDFLGGLQTVLTFSFASSLASKRPWSLSTPNSPPFSFPESKLSRPSLFSLSTNLCSSASGVHKLRPKCWQTPPPPHRRRYHFPSLSTFPPFLVPTAQKDAHARTASNFPERRKGLMRLRCWVWCRGHT
ncbi:hypothetical protein BSKO_10692 [Bryopsis sp. KO-2023]|nr:hypothetical protein BSKO_10692 [Bryopsis sp. KO-2023]